MPKYIDAEKLSDFARNHIGGMIDVNDIERFPVEEAEPIKHGHWIVKTVFGMVSASCSECRRGALGTVDKNDVFKPTLSPACPFCFARMDGADLKS